MLLLFDDNFEIITNNELLHLNLTIALPLSVCMLHSPPKMVIFYPRKV